MTERQEKMSKEMTRVASTFISENSNRSSLITITRTDISPDFKNITFYVSILPVDTQETAILFLNRKRSDLKHYLKKNLATRVIPFVTFKADEGEKNRQRIEELLNEDAQNDYSN